MPSLSAPRLLTVLASAVVIGLAAASLSALIPAVHRTAAHREWFFIGACVLLALWVTRRRL